MDSSMYSAYQGSRLLSGCATLDQERNYRQLLLAKPRPATVIINLVTSASKELFISQCVLILKIEPKQLSMRTNFI